MLLCTPDSKDEDMNNLLCKFADGFYSSSHVFIYISWKCLLFTLESEDIINIINMQIQNACKIIAPLTTIKLGSEY